MTVTNDIKYIGVNDHQIDLFEGQYDVPLGMAYNSYAIIDDKIAVMDTVDKNFGREWLENLESALCGRIPDYLIIQHMEPDHSSNIKAFIEKYPDAVIVSSDKAFVMMKNFFGIEKNENCLAIKEGDTLSLGRHELHFIAAPMVHWPEVMVTYDSEDKVLFSADGFGNFGANDVEAPEGWACEARRYYFGIVGKYGAMVQNLLKKAANLDIQIICPLHGPVLKDDLGYYINIYDTWSSYGVESDGVVIAYTSVYGNTAKAASLLAEALDRRGCEKIVLTDLARSDMYEDVEDAFRYGKIVLATTTYNGDIFPYMKQFIDHLTERGYKNRTIGIIENGSWAPQAANIIRKMFEGSKNISFLDTTVTLMSGVSSSNLEEIEKLADELMKG